MSEPTDVSLEERLSSYGQVLDHHIEQAPPSRLRTTTRPVAVRTMIAVAAAAALVVVGGGFIVAALNRTEVTVTSPTDRTDTSADATEPAAGDQEPDPSIEPIAPTDIEPPPDSEGFPGADGCANTFGSMVEESAGLAAPQLFDPRTEVEQVVVLALPASPSAVQVILIGPGGFYTCATSRNGSTVQDLSAGHIDPLAAVEPDQILLVSQSWESATDEGTTGPGSIRTVGRVGPEIAAVWIALADGTTLPGLIDDGWLTLNGDIPRDVPLFTERYYWRLTDGTTKSADADQLAPVSPAEQCAATEGCIEQRLVELQQTAATQGLDQQAAALADGWVDPEEQIAATRATVECLIEAGFNAEISPDGLGMMINGAPDDPDVTFESQAECRRLHSELISELTSLLDASGGPYSDDDLLAGVDLTVADRDGVVRNAVFYVGADRASLEAEIDPALDNPPMLISFSLTLCEQLPHVIVDYLTETGAISIEIVPQEGAACEERPRTAVLQLHLEPDIEIRTVETKVG